jgi:hypothetical protein
MFEHKVVAVRATGVAPESVADTIEKELASVAPDRWELQMIQPVIYNSSTTGYLLLILRRPVGAGDAPE